MYSILKTVIKAQGYDLRGMLSKINNFWAEGNINEQERNELIRLAQENAHMKNEVDILSKVEELDKRVRALEEKLANYEEVEKPEEDNGEPEVVTYPEYIAGKWYYAGDIVSFDAKNYICIAPDGAVCTWSPSEYPAYWAEYVEQVEDDMDEESAEETDQPIIGDEDGEPLS